MTKLFTNYFLVKKPFLWALGITFLIEITWLIIERQEYLDRIINHPIKYIITFTIKLGMFLLLSYGYRYYSIKK